LPETDEVSGGMDWVDRLAHGRRLLDVIGLGIGAVLAVAAILTVTTATTLVLHLRRQELEIMRLVGAPELVVRLPLLLQGMLQGLLGAVMAIWLLIAVYALAGPHLEPLVNQTLGLERLTFLKPHTVVGLMLAGTMLGGFGGWLARGRMAPRARAWRSHWGSWPRSPARPARRPPRSPRTRYRPSRRSCSRPRSSYATNGKRPRLLGRAKPPCSRSWR